MFCDSSGASWRQPQPSTKPWAGTNLLHYLRVDPGRLPDGAEYHRVRCFYSTMETRSISGPAGLFAPRPRSSISKSSEHVEKLCPGRQRELSQYDCR